MVKMQNPRGNHRLDLALAALRALVGLAVMQRSREGGVGFGGWCCVCPTTVMAPSSQPSLPTTGVMGSTFAWLYENRAALRFLLGGAAGEVSPTTASTGGLANLSPALLSCSS